MATRLKTIRYSFTTLAIAANDTLTAFFTKTIYIPEGAGTISFKSVTVEISVEQPASMGLGNYTTRRIDANLAGAGAVSYTNSNTYTGSGETITLFYGADLTSNFNTNWGSATTSNTLALSVQIANAASGAGNVNVTAELTITYEYDDTITTQIKTVYIPLSQANGTLGTSKGLSISDTIPALDTFCPESSKTFRDMYIVFQGNLGSSLTDSNLSFEIDSLGAYTTETTENGQGSHRWTRNIYNFTSLAIDTSTTHTVYLWSNILGYNHPQWYLVVTYEFDSTASSDTLVSLLLPTELASPAGGTSSTSAQLGTRDLWIEEPGTITTERIAYYAFWDQANSIVNMFWRLGQDSYSQLTDVVGQVCGSNGCMLRSDSAFTLKRGKNTLTVNCYRSETADLGYNLSGFFMICYKASKPPQGYGACNHTTILNLGRMYNGTAAFFAELTALDYPLPESKYFVSSVGTAFRYITNAGAVAAGTTITLERLPEEGGPEWIPSYVDISHTDPETGLRLTYSQIRSAFRRWPGDVDISRVPLTGIRKWRIAMAGAAACYFAADLMVTYHSIYWNVTGAIAGSNNGVITGILIRELDNVYEEVYSQTTTGDSNIVWHWYDNTSGMYISAYEDQTHVGRSAKFTF